MHMCTCICRGERRVTLSLPGKEDGNKQRETVPKDLTYLYFIALYHFPSSTYEHTMPWFH